MKCDFCGKLIKLREECVIGNSGDYHILCAGDLIDELKAENAEQKKTLNLIYGLLQYDNLDAEAFLGTVRKWIKEHCERVDGGG